MNHGEKRTVIVPCFSDAVDVTVEAELVDHPDFQRLFSVMQLGSAEKVFPGAKHSRAEHMLGAYHRTKVLVRWLQSAGMLHETQLYVLRVYALLHDVGHGPKSHAVEWVTTRDHKENGVRILGNLAPAIARLGVAPERIVAMMEKRDPLGAIVSDYNLGTEKIDYLERDAYHIGKRIGDTARLSRYLVYADGRLGIDWEVIEDAKRLLTDYAYMYKSVYYKPRCLRYERMLAKMVAALLDEDEVLEDALWEMTDGELDGALARSAQDPVTELYARYRRADTPVTIVVARPAGTERFEEPKEQKRIHPIDPAFFPDALRAPAAVALVSAIEGRVASLLGLDRWQVVAMPPLEKRRFRPEDIPIYYRGTWHSMRERNPHAFADIENTYEQYAGIRICVFREHAEQARERSAAIADIATDVLREAYAARARQTA